MSRRKAWIFLILAIILEVLGVSMLSIVPKIALAHSDSDHIKIFEYAISAHALGKALMLLLIAGSYYCMALALTDIPLGVAYSTWEIIGLIGTLLISFIFFDPSLTLRQYIGIAVGFIGIICVILGEEH